MGLIRPGYFPARYFPANYFNDRYFPSYAFVEQLRILSALIAFTKDDAYREFLLRDKYLALALDAAGLSSVVTGHEDYTAFNKSDPTGKLSVTARSIKLTDGDRNQDYYVTDDKGANYFEDFIHFVDNVVTSLSDNASCTMNIWALSNAHDDLYDIAIDNNDDLIAMFNHQSVSTTHTKVSIYYATGGALTTIADSINIPVGTNLYHAISRTGSILKAEIYSSAALRSARSAGDIGTLSGSCIASKFQYVHGLGSWAWGGTGMPISGVNSNLLLNPPLSILSKERTFIMK